MHPLSRIIVTDLETSGLNPNKCAILQIGAVSLNLDSAPEFECLARLEHWHEWEAGAAKVHGETREEAASIRRLAEAVALEQFLDWADDLGGSGRFILAGMNPAFDMGFLRCVAKRSDQSDRLRGLFAHRTLDMHSLAVAEMLSHDSDPLDLHTDAIYEMLGHGPEAKPHRAIEGARREAAAILELLNLSVL
jgi:DNA polymerase III epsilon subunit-like protein